jgi:glutamate synthase (NADPH/NADH) small chain
VATKAFLGNNGNVEKLLAVRLDWQKNEQGQMVMKEIPGSEFEVKADLVLLAMGYVHPIHEGLLKSLGVGLDTRGNIQASTDNYQTNLDKVFAAGDIRRGQSLVVWAIREGRQAARAVDEYLMGSSVLPR